MSTGYIGYTEGGPTRLHTERVETSPGVYAHMERVVSSSGVMDSIGSPVIISAVGQTSIIVNTASKSSIVVAARAAVPEDTEIVVALVMYDSAGEIICLTEKKSIYFSAVTDLAGDTVSEPAIFENSVGASTAKVVVSSIQTGTSASIYANAI